MVIKNTLISLFFLPGFLSAAQPQPECTQKNPAVAVTTKSPVFSVRLASNSTTGYRWFLSDAPSAVMPLSAHYEKPATPKGMVGAGGEEVWQFKVRPDVVPKQYILHFVYARSFESGQAGAFSCQVSSIPGG